jgi:uncharacterized Zn finger protein
LEWYDWLPYVPVDVRRARAVEAVAALRTEGQDIQPVEIQGRRIARTFWGKAWCAHLASFSDYGNRLPRGRTYVLNRAVCHLAVGRGEVNAIVSGSDLYTVKVAVETLAPEKWGEVKRRCAGQIGSLLELLQGRLSDNVMAVVTDRDEGLFPRPGEISLRCSCPDWAVMCKHVAAALYGVGARLDERPELLFLLRGVDHEELISTDVGLATAGRGAEGRRRIADEALGDVFGIEMAQEAVPAEAGRSPGGKQRRRKARGSAKAAAGRKVRRRTGGAKGAGPRRGRPGRAAAATGSARPVTGKAVAALRGKFGMSQVRFARLLGVSPTSVQNWERQRGPLRLHTRTRSAWRRAQGLTKRQAWAELGDR